MNKIDTYLNTLPEWQSQFLSTFRSLINDVAPKVVEEFKWNVPVFMINGKVYFAISAFKVHVKFNFMYNGAALNDPMHLFNNGFDSKKSRAIDCREGDIVDIKAVRVLIEESLRK